MIFERQQFVNQLIEHIGNNMIKVVTGMRRCGKSYLLFELFHNYLLSHGIAEDHLIEIRLDNRLNMELRNPDVCLKYIVSRIQDEKQYYLLMDEVQLMDEFEDVLASCLQIKNLDCYVSGSNSHLLSSDIITEFRDRGDEIRLFPLSFSEYMKAFPDKSWDAAWSEYSTYGGLPHTLQIADEKGKIKYLKDLLKKTYLKDIVDRYKIKDEAPLGRLLDILCSSIGSLTNPKKLEDTFKSVGRITLTDATIKQYIDYFEDAFMLNKAERYDVKGKRYISTPLKYYLSDVGLRNARLNFRQIEETHLMENIIYNELIYRGFGVDVGVVEVYERDGEGKQTRKQIEINFVVNNGSNRYYIQSAFALPDQEKIAQEERPLKALDDSFKKIVIVKDDILLRRNEDGIVTMGLRQFLTDPNSLDL